MMIAIPMLTACMLHAVELLPRVRYRKVGGLRFLKVGRLQMSFCITKAAGSTTSHPAVRNPVMMPRNPDDYR
jgi:hypothetical protein